MSGKPALAQLTEIFDDSDFQVASDRLRGVTDEVLDGAGSTRISTPVHQRANCAVRHG
jgi:hypothetical protein